MAHKGDIVDFGKAQQSWLAGFSQSKKDSRKDKAVRWGRTALRLWKANKLQEHELNLDQTELDNSIALGVANANVIKAKEQYDLRRPWMDRIEGEGFSVSDPASDYLYDEEAWKRARRSNKIFNSAHPEDYLDYASFDKAHRSGEISPELHESMSNLYKSEKKDLIQFVRSGKKFDPVRQNALLTQLSNMQIDVGDPSLFNMITGHTRRRVALQDQAIDAFRNDFISKPVQNTLADFALWEENREDIETFRKLAENTPPSGLDLIPNTHLEILALGDKRARKTVVDHITSTMQAYSENNNGEVMPQRQILQEFTAVTYGTGNPGEGTQVLYRNLQGQRASLIAKITEGYEPGEDLSAEDETKLTDGLARLDATYRKTIGQVNHLSTATAQSWIANQTSFKRIIDDLEDRIKTRRSGETESELALEGQLEYARMMYNRAPGTTSQDIRNKMEFMKTLKAERNEDIALSSFTEAIKYNFSQNPNNRNTALSTYHFGIHGLDPELPVYKNFNIYQWNNAWEQSDGEKVRDAANAKIQIDQMLAEGITPSDPGFSKAYTPYVGKDDALLLVDADRSDKLAAASLNTRNIVGTNNRVVPGLPPYLGGQISYENALKVVVANWPTYKNENGDPVLENLEVRQIENFLHEHLLRQRFSRKATGITGFHIQESPEFPGTTNQVIHFDGITDEVRTMPDQFEDSGLSDDEIDSQVRDGRNKITNAINQSREEAQKTYPQRVIDEFDATIQEKYGDGAFLLSPGTREWDAAVAPGRESDSFAGDREG
jgi:hypothetical protein